MNKLIWLLGICFLLISLNSAAQYADTDLDGIPDWWEVEHFGCETCAQADADPDDDGLTNLEEFLHKTSPLMKDSDGDGYTDSEEIMCGSNPINAANYCPYSLNHISLVMPPYGVSKLNKFDLIIRTSNHTQLCKYSENPNLKFTDIHSTNNFFSTSDNYHHTIKDFDLSNLEENFVRNIYVICNATGGYINDEFPKNISLSTDKTPPNIISAVAQPDFLIERLETMIIVRTDDKTLCYFDEANVSFSMMKYSFDNVKNLNFSTINKKRIAQNTTPYVEDERNYTYYVACMNGAEDKSSTAKITFSVNLSEQNKINFAGPSGYYNAASLRLEVMTNKDSSCYYGEHLDNLIPPRYSKYHYLDLSPAEGVHNYNVLCNFDLGGPSARADINFVIDRTKPSITSVSMPTEICPDRQMTVNFSATDNFGISGYMYRLFGPGLNVTGFTTLNNASFNFNFTEESTYYIEVFAVDLAMNNGTSGKGNGTRILSAMDDKCRLDEPPSLNFTAVMADNEVFLALICVDDKQCVQTSYALKNEMCECGNCAYSSYMSSLRLKGNTTVCYRVRDNTNKTVNGSIDIIFSGCNEDEDCCARKRSFSCVNGNCTMIRITSCDLSKIDSDGDGIFDKKELDCGLDPYYSGDAMKDFDSDGLTNKDECLKYGTDINRSDSDGDGFSDYEEATGGTEPLNPRSYPMEEEPPPLVQPEEEEGEEEKGFDKMLNIALIITGVILSMAGLMVFLAKTKKNELHFEKPSKIVDFAHSKNEMEREIKTRMERQNEQQKILSEKAASKAALELAIRKKREMIKLRRMNSLFDEFADEKNHLEKNERRGRVAGGNAAFEKLDKFSDEDDAFDWLEKLSKKRRNKKQGVEKDEKVTGG